MVERRLREQRERIRQLVASRELRAAIRERWEEGWFFQMEQVSREAFGEGYASESGMIVGEEPSAVRDRVLRMLPELKELGGDQKGEGNLSPESVYGALRNLEDTARREEQGDGSASSGGGSSETEETGGVGGGEKQGNTPLLPTSERGEWGEEDHLKGGGGHFRGEGRGDDLPGGPEKGAPGGDDWRRGRESGHGQGDQKGRSPTDRCEPNAKGEPKAKREPKAKGEPKAKDEPKAREGTKDTPKIGKKPVATSTPRTEREGDDSPSTSFLRSLAGEGEGEAGERTRKD
ncbi:golgin subfamily A member 6-like protein 2 [Euwallacea similis]|uniref:golgin subfamily A member 6-like protein 2 n=1 Tax=Euwallacea similis TaxID=1736056 RepID=UPI00344F6E31